jgi:ParB family transcriptional regulator, chromosome partitioning protein
MTKIKPGLGRGLDALINQQNNRAEQPEEQNEIRENENLQFEIIVKIPVDIIAPNPYQPRMNFDVQALEELKKSILSNGLIQPITVRRTDSGTYELISGERRLKACIDIGYKDIPAYVIKVDTEEGMLAMALIENIQREKLNPIEIGLAYKRLMDECRLTQEQIAERVGKDRTTVANSIRLLKLPQAIQDSLIKEEITAGHARALINLPYAHLQLDLLQKIKEANLSVRKVEQLVKKYLTQPEVKKHINFNRSNESGASLNEFEDKLRKTFGTKVICKQRNDGTGEIVIEFYSKEELERLYELFEIIDKSYS